MKNSLIFVALLIPGVASAQTPTNATPNGAGAGSATNTAAQVICRTQRDTGSLLNRTRVCKTRAEWEANRRDTRQAIDRHQLNRPTSGQ